MSDRRPLREAEIRLLNAAEWPCVNYRVDDERRLSSRDEPRPFAPRRLGLGAAAFVATTRSRIGSPGRARSRTCAAAPPVSRSRATTTPPRRSSTRG